MRQVFPYEMGAHLLVSDEDAADFLQSQFSKDLRRLAPGESSYGLWLDVKGKVVADSWVLCEGPEQFRIFSEHGSTSLIQEKLERHIIADDVVIEPQAPVAALAVFDATVDELAAEFEGLARLPGHRAPEPSVECVFTQAAQRDGMMQKLKAEHIPEKLLHEKRLEAGIPLVPVEIGPGELPGEGGLDRFAVDFDKGCFLGQEVVARMRNVGKPARALYLLSGTGVAPETGEAVSLEGGKRAGSLRSVYPGSGGWQGVALLKIRQANGELQVGGQAVLLERVFQPLEAKA